MRKNTIKEIKQFNIKYILSDETHFIDKDVEAIDIAEAYKLATEEYAKEFNNVYGFFEQVHVSDYKLVITDIT